MGGGEEMAQLGVEVVGALASVSEGAPHCGQKRRGAGREVPHVEQDRVAECDIVSFLSILVLVT